VKAITHLDGGGDGGIGHLLTRLEVEEVFASFSQSWGKVPLSHIPSKSFLKTQQDNQKQQTQR